ADPSYSRLVAAGDAAALAGAVGEMLGAPPVVDAELVRQRNISVEASARLLADCLEEAVVAGQARPPTHDPHTRRRTA
ncbi:MAG TPA: hypothetical protein VG013_27290, partial [Gemmataceae bacterium]|nr:hypothetical protein [Gemmataceae bacterium]